MPRQLAKFASIHARFHAGRALDQGLGLVVVLLAILGISLTSTLLFIRVSTMRDAERILITGEKLLAIARTIASLEFTPVPHDFRAYEDDVGSLPAGLSDLIIKPAAVPVCSVGANNRLQGWCGPYWTHNFSGEGFKDAWQRAIIYDSANRKLRSAGANGTDEGGAGDDIVQNF